jgi:hypothetical protein
VRAPGSARVAAVVGLVVSAGLAGGAAYALVQVTDDDTRSTAAATQPTPAALTPTPTPTASPTPSPTPAPVVTVTPTASPGAVPTATPTPRPTGPVRTYAYPKPTTSYQGLSLSATIDPGNGDTTDVFSVTVKATDGDGRTYFAGLDWGDGTTVAADPSPRRCASYPPLTSPPGPYRPQPDARTFGPYRHRFTRGGTYTVTVRVSSVNADCRPNGPQAETSAAVFEKVQVFVPSSAQPSPTP